MPAELEETEELKLDFNKLLSVAATGEKLLPVVVQDYQSGEVLQVAYANEEALRLSLIEKRAIFYSTSRRTLWRKGETSGDVLHLREIRVNCEQNSLLFLVEKAGEGSCHTSNQSGKHRSSCFYRRLRENGKLEFVEGMR